MRVHRMGEAPDIVMQRLQIDELDRPDTRRPREFLRAHDRGELGAEFGQIGQIERGLAVGMPTKARQPLDDIG